MTSEIRTNSFKSRAGLSTVTLTDTGPIISGVVTATSFSGDGSNLTGISAGTALSGSTDNTVCTVTGANAIQGEANLTFDGDNLTITGSNHVTQVLKAGGATSDLHIDFKDSSNNLEARIFCASDQGDLRFYTGGANERLRITSDGKLSLGTINSSPAAAVHIDYDTNNMLMLDNSSASTQKIFFAQNAATHAQIYATSTQGSLIFESDPSNNHNDSLINFTIDGTSRLRIDSTGRMTQNGTTSADTASALTLKNGVSGNDHTILELISDPNQYSMIYLGASDDRYKGQIRYKDNDHFMQFYTNGSEKLRITSAGYFKLGSTDGGSYHTIRLNTTTNNAIKDVLHVHSSVDGATAAAGYGVRLNFSGEQSNGNEYTFGGIAGLFSSTGATYGDLAFYTNNNNTNTERLRINSSGDILTAQNGTPFSWPSNPGHVIYPNGEYRSTSTNGTHIRCNRMNGDGHVAQWYRGQTNMVGYITITSSGTGYGSGSSDERTKKNIEAWDENILDKFKSLTPSKFNFNWEDDSVSKHKGYIAQNEFEKFPEAYPKNNLTDCDNEYHMFVPTDMTVYLMKGLKEAAEKIEQLEQENIALRIRVTNLEDN